MNRIKEEQIDMMLEIVSIIGGLSLIVTVITLIPALVSGMVLLAFIPLGVLVVCMALLVILTRTGHAPP